MKIEIYTINNGGPFYVWTKQWFEENDIAFNEKVIYDYAQRGRFYDQINQSGTVTFPISTVPQIFIDYEHIVGFTDLKTNADKILNKN